MEEVGRCLNVLWDLEGKLMDTLEEICYFRIFNGMAIEVPL